MDKSYLHYTNLFLLLLSAGVEAAAPLPGASLDKPGAPTVGAPANTSPVSAMWVDKNGDGLIQKDEVIPGTQLAKRFDTRDANHDGTLSRDEYFY